MQILKTPSQAVLNASNPYKTILILLNGPENY
jgi:hypothetical protein